MTSLLYLDYVALIIYYFMLVAWFFRLHKRRSYKGLYLPLLLVATFTCVFDIFTIIFNVEGSYFFVLKYVLNGFYLVLRSLIPLLYVGYIISVTETWHKIVNNSYIKSLIALPCVISAIMTITSPLTHLIYYIDDSGLYKRGPAFFVLYIDAAIYFILCLYFCIRYSELLKPEKYIPLLSIIPSQVATVIIQLMFPHILCEMIATAISLLLIMITIEKQEEKFNPSTGLLKSEIFYDMIDNAKSVSRPYSAIFINIANHSLLSDYLPLSGMVALYSSVARRLEAIGSQLKISAEIYDLENGLFSVVLYGDDIEFANRYASYAFETLKHDCMVNGLNLTVLPSVCVFKFPEDTKSVEQLRLFLSDLRNHKYSNGENLASTYMKNKDYTIMANMDTILKDAIENDRFEVYYQPIYSNEKNGFNSAEALLRLITPEYGFIRPDLFIPMAEESGAIHKIGLIVLEKVCRFISSDEFKKLGLDYIEVNLSVVQCMDKNLADKILSVCKKYGVNPSQLNLEITETASIFTQRNMIKNINRLFETGYSFSLDDFGTGYSNLVRIASLPLNIVKLDKSFTWTENSEDLKIILENTINMIKKMNMKIVVEGVETEEMLKRFKDLGCEYIQGYYFSKPLPEYDFINYIKDAS